jgi:hypothetical protein
MSQALVLGLVVTLVVLALSACGSGGAKVSAAEATIMKTVAGDGGSQLGDGGPATEAGFCSTTDVALDAEVNIYIADAWVYCSAPRAITPFGRWILMGPSPQWRAPERSVSPAMVGPPPRQNSISHRRGGGPGGEPLHPRRGYPAAATFHPYPSRHPVATS